MALKQPLKRFKYLSLELAKDLGEGGDVSELLGDLLVLDGPLLGVLAVLVLEVLEVVAAGLDLVGERLLVLGHLLGVRQHDVVVQAVKIQTSKQVSFPWDLDCLLLLLPGGEGLSVDVDDGLLPEVDPEDVLLVAVLLHDGLEARVEAGQGRLARAEHGEAGQLEKAKQRKVK